MFMNNYMLTPKMPIPNSIACLSTFLKLLSTFIKKFSKYSGILYNHIHLYK